MGLPALGVIWTTLSEGYDAGRRFVETWVPERFRAFLFLIVVLVFLDITILKGSLLMLWLHKFFDPLANLYVSVESLGLGIWYETAELMDTHDIWNVGSLLIALAAFAGIIGIIFRTVF